MTISVLLACMSVDHICAGTCGGQKRALNPLEEIQGAGSCPVWVMGIELQSSSRTVRAVNCCAASSAPFSRGFIETD